MAAPTFVQEAETAWNSNPATRATASFPVQTGDVLVAFAITADQATTISSVAGGSLTWTQQQAVVTASNTWVSVWTATATSSTSFAVTFTRAGSNGSTIWWGGNVLTFRGSAGVGASSKTTGTGAPSLGLTTTAANSAIVTVNGDWAAISGTTRTWRTVNGITPTSGNGLEVTFDNTGAGSAYVVYGAYYSDAGAAGSPVTVGLTAPTGQTFAIVAVEVKGTAGGATPMPQRILSIPSPAVTRAATR